MPFKVKFQIFEPGKQAPYFTTSNARLAHAEYRDHCNKHGCAFTRMTTDIECIDLTKPEQYVYLVYQVRSLQRQYFYGGRSQDVFKQALEKEKQLDNWNARTRYHLQTHPKCRPDDDKAFAFFQVVEEWRNLWHKYFAYKKRANSRAQGISLGPHDYDPAVEREMKKQCFDFEKEIDKYINLVIGL